jgi:hypothetical protein
MDILLIGMTMIIFGMLFGIYVGKSMNKNPEWYHFLIILFHLLIAMICKNKYDTGILDEMWSCIYFYVWIFFGFFIYNMS